MLRAAVPARQVTIKKHHAVRTDHLLGLVDHDGGGEDVVQHVLLLLLPLDAHVLHRVRNELCGHHCTVAAISTGLET